MTKPSEPSKAEVFACTMCGSQFYSQNDLEEHKEMNHDQPKSPAKRVST